MTTVSKSNNVSYLNEYKRTVKSIEVLNRSAKAVLYILNEYINKDYECYPSVKRIAKDLQISPRTVQRAIKELEENELIKKTERFSPKKNGGQTSNLYTIIIEKVKQISKKAVEKVEKKMEDIKETITKPCEKPAEELSTNDEHITTEFLHTPKNTVTTKNIKTRKNIIAKKIVKNNNIPTKTTLIKHSNINNILNLENYLDAKNTRQQSLAVDTKIKNAITKKLLHLLFKGYKDEASLHKNKTKTTSYFSHLS